MRTLLITILLLISAPSWATADSGKTVSDNKVISKAIRDQLSPGMADAILSAEYDGFYQIYGKQTRGDSFEFNRVKSKKSFPDNRWEQLAVELTERVNYKGESKGIGSRSKARATAYVVFYKNGIEGIAKRGESESLALVMIDHKNASKNSMPEVKGLSAASLYLLDTTM